MMATQSREVAVIGMSCRVPSAISKADFWTLLEDGRTAFSTWPAQRWSLVSDAVAQAKSALPEDRLARSMMGGFLEDVAGFDADLFGISPREARSMDPQQRLLMEECWQALLDAAIAPQSLAGSAVGVFMGLCSYDYGLLGHDGWTNFGPYSALGAAQCLAANRISHALDLKGPSYTIDAACASSLVSLHLAVESLVGGACDLALAGGANLVLAPTVNTSFDRAGMLSKSGRCRVFDQAADGYLRSEAAGVAVLKRREDAERDGDPIYAVIMASAVAHNGRTGGIVHPSREAQVDLLLQCWKRAKIGGRDLAFVEAHGTGTAVGDALEIEALNEAFGARETPCYVGSLKANIGHTEAAAGILSVIKAALSLHKRRLPPHVGADEPLALATADDGPLRLARENVSLSDKGAPLCAGVSAFGFGGAICHMVLRAADEPVLFPVSESPTITLSALSEERLRALAARWAEALQDGTPDMLDAAARWSNRIYPADHTQLAVEATDALEAAGKLLVGTSDSRHPGPSSSPLLRSFEPPVYPFQRKRYWLKADTPLPTDATIDTTIALNFDTPCIRQHRIADLVIVPGAAILARVQDAVRPRFDGRGIVFEDVSFHRPIVIDGSGRGKVALQLEPQGTEGFVFRVTADGPSARTVLFASGSVMAECGGP